MNQRPAWTEIPLEEIELLPADDFTQKITQEIDEYFEHSGLGQQWIDEKAKDDPEAVDFAILHRMVIGWYNEIFVRDAAVMLLEVAPPSLKTQQALLKQIEDEHKHAIWLLDLMQKRGTDPRDIGTTREWRIFWSSIYGETRGPDDFFSTLATTQLVSERLFGLRATVKFAEAIEEHDPEVAHLYGEKIYRDEIFHTIQLPEMILRDHCHTVEAQNRVRYGVEKAKILLNIIFQDTLKMKEEKKIKL